MIDFACKRFELDEIIKCSLGLTKSDMVVLKHLIRSGEEYNTEELAKKLGLDLTTVQRSMKKLHGKGVVDRRQQNLQGGGYVFYYESAPKKKIRQVIEEIVHSWVKQVSAALQNW